MDKHCKYLVHQPFRCCGAPLQLARHNVVCVISSILLALVAIKHKYELLVHMLSLFSIGMMQLLTCLHVLVLATVLLPLYWALVIATTVTSW